MNRLFLGSVALLPLAAAGPAIAADMPAQSRVYKAAPTTVMTPHNWTGFYIGAGWGRGMWNHADHWLHVALAVVILAAGFMLPDDKVA